MKAYALASLLALLQLACTSSNFSGDSKPARKDADASGPQPPAGPKPGQGPSAGPTPSDPSNNDNSIDDIIDEDGNRCLKQTTDVNIVFLMDVTGSMDESIELVKRNVADFASRVQTVQFGTSKIKVADVSVGGVAYRDAQSEQQIMPVGDPARFGQQVANLRADGGGDPHEGGLLALKSGLEALKAAPQHEDRDVITVVVAITDTLSHNGVGGAMGDLNPFDPFGMPGGTAMPKRECSPDWAPLKTLLGDRTFDRLLIYDASPNTADPLGGASVPPGFVVPPELLAQLRCDPYGDQGAPAKQWGDLRDRWKATRPKAKSASGRGFGFPFSADALVETLPDDIKKSFVACEE